MNQHDIFSAIINGKVSPEEVENAVKLAIDFAMLQSSLRNMKINLPNPVPINHNKAEIEAVFKNTDDKIKTIIACRRLMDLGLADAKQWCENNIFGA